MHSLEKRPSTIYKTYTTLSNFAHILLFTNPFCYILSQRL